MTPTHTRRGGRLYRYYICSGMLRHGRDADAAPETSALRRIAAGEIERAVIDQVRILLRTPEIIVQTWRAAGGSDAAASNDVASVDAFGSTGASSADG